MAVVAFHKSSAFFLNVSTVKRKNTRGLPDLPVTPTLVKKPRWAQGRNEERKLCAEVPADHRPGLFRLCGTSFMQFLQDSPPFKGLGWWRTSVIRFSGPCVSKELRGFVGSNRLHEDSIQCAEELGQVGPQFSSVFFFSFLPTHKITSKDGLLSEGSMRARARCSQGLYAHPYPVGFTGFLPETHGCLC